jgi:hypothetical protein
VNHSLYLSNKGDKEEHTGTVIGLEEWEVFVNEFHGRITQEVEV